MRIGLDLTSLRGAELGGMASQAFWLARWMPELAPGDTFTFFLTPGTRPPSEAANVRVVRVPWPGLRGARIITEQVLLPIAARRERLDLLHTIAFGPPILYSRPKLLTIHDLGFRLHPGTVPPRFRHYWNWAYGPAARNCRHLIAVSQATKADASRLLGRPPGEITVVYPGIDPIYLEPPIAGENQSVADPPYLLNVGVMQPRKDLDTLLKAFAGIRRVHPELKLVVCGPRGWGYPDPEELARRHGVGGRVEFRTGVPREAMPGLYARSMLFLFTSLHEGFGLPLLEAMASGTPVVSTSNSAIPEVVGDAATLTETGNPAAVTRAVLGLLGDPDRRAELVRRGRVRASEFSWRRSAEETLTVYRRILAE